MGSLSSSAKAPSQSPKVVYVPAPTITETKITAEDSEAIAGKAREESLLRRARGRLGTVATSLSGFLSESESKNTRKTLLGE
jgi:hypothetical protein